MKKEINYNLRKVIKEVTDQEVAPEIFYPTDEKHGDYSSNVAMTLFSKSKVKTPLELAQSIVEKLRINNQKLRILARIEAAAPGFINFWLSEKYLTSQLKEILDKKDKFGLKPKDMKKKVVVEYSSPNIAKPFTVGHLRSTIIGDVIANLMEANGWKVYRDNHLGDWGTQFGKQIYAIKKWGNEEEIGKSENPVKMLVDLYIKFHQEAEKDPSLEDEGRSWFKKLEDADQEARRLWQKCVDWSLKEFKKIYSSLGIEFTENNGIGYGESFFEDKMRSVIEELENKDLLKESEGAKLVFFEKGKFPPLMIIKKDGTTLYATRDLATDKFRLEKYGKEIVIINEVGIEQSLYFKQLFEVEKMLGWYKERQRIHIKHGLYRFKDRKMSTRRGNAIWLEEVLEEAQKRAISLSKDKNFSIAKDVGIGALKWNDLKRSSNIDIVFDWDEILNMQGNSGPYLQYTYARTQSVLAKIKNQESKVKGDSGQASLPPKLQRRRARMTSFWGAERLQNLNTEEVSLLRSLNRFLEVVEEAGEKFAPNLLCNYLFDLAQKFNLFYQKHKILESQNQDFRLELTSAVGQVLKNGLSILGIKAPDKI